MTPRPCTAAAALGVIGEKWSLLVVRELAFGVHRFDSIVAEHGRAARHPHEPASAPRERGRRREAAVQRAPAPLRVPPDAGRPRAEADSPQPRPMGKPLGGRCPARGLRAHVRREARARAHVQGVRRGGNRGPRREARTGHGGLDARRRKDGVRCKLVCRLAPATTACVRMVLVNQEVGSAEPSGHANSFSLRRSKGGSACRPRFSSSVSTLPSTRCSSVGSPRGSSREWPHSASKAWRIGSKTPGTHSRLRCGRC